MDSTPERLLRELTLSGFKSFYTKQAVNVAPLTLLAGANSSGKSSVTQVLLLLKQTVEAPFDPGALLLNGANIRMTSASQLLARSSRVSRASFSAGMKFMDGYGYETSFTRNPLVPGGFELNDVTLTWNGVSTKLNVSSSDNELRELHTRIRQEWSPYEIFQSSQPGGMRAELGRSRCFLEVRMHREGDAASAKGHMFTTPLPKSERLRYLLQRLIHVPGIRANPERTYVTTAVGNNFPGRFESYVASIIRHWQETKSAKFRSLLSQLQNLGLTASLRTERVSDTEVEIRVSRRKVAKPLRGEASSRRTASVSIADVGFGVSQVLPVLVALLVADTDQIVIIEQPELHLHPRAQTRLADVIVDASKRGVRVIVETHSSLLLLGIQTAVANGRLEHHDVALNWFATNESGHTKVTVGEVNPFGSFGNWPTDFMDVGLEAESEFLNAVESKMAHGKN